MDEFRKHMINRTDRLESDGSDARMKIDSITRWVMWASVIFGLLITALCLICARPAHATTWFNLVPNTLVNGTTGLSAQVNADYAQIVTDGNAANVNLLAQIVALGPGGLPGGAVVAFNSACPTGFALADGAHSRPDARGLFIRGLDNQAGRDPNRILGSYQADQIQNHFHAPGSPFFQMVTSSSPISGGGNLFIYGPTGEASTITSFMTAPVGLPETRPANIVLSYCMNNSTGIGSTPFSPSPQILSNLIVPDANIMMTDYNQIIIDGNAAFNALQAAITAAGVVPAMPAGAVVPFNLAVCPSGWVSSDGTGGTVDMRGRFARITTGSPAVGTVQADQFLNHTHTVMASPPNVTVLSGGFNFTGGSGGLASSFSSLSILDATGANIGTETRPQNIAFLYCQKS